MQPDICTTARAEWSNEALYGTKWDNYTQAFAADNCGPDGNTLCHKNNCITSNHVHCGDTFFPLLADQHMYLPDDHPGCFNGDYATGLTGAAKANIPWSAKWIRPFCSYLAEKEYTCDAAGNKHLQTSFWNGHAGPYFRRNTFGWSFYDPKPGNQHSNVGFHGRWGADERRDVDSRGRFNGAHNVYVNPYPFPQIEQPDGSYVCEPQPQ